MHAAASKACPHSFLAGLQVAREVGAREHTLAEGGMSLPLPPAPLSPQEGEGGGGRCCIAHAHSAVGRCHAFSLVTMMCRGPQTLCRAVPSAVFVPVALS